MACSTIIARGLATTRLMRGALGTNYYEQVETHLKHLLGDKRFERAIDEMGHGFPPAPDLLSS
jgi:hypothetical protein